MTPTQLATLKTYVLANLAQYTSGPGTDYQAIANALNADTVTFKVWKTSAQRNDLLGDGFDWTQVDNLTNGQARIWDWLFDNGRSINPALASVRSAISEVWKGTAQKVAVGIYVLGLCKRNANLAEKLLATGTGSDAVPATLTFEGSVQTSDIGAILA